VNVERDEEREIPESRYIRSLTFEMLNDIMYILPKVDLLITDYSSIQTDFLLLNRPIVYIPYDLDEFRKTEGFCYPEYDFWSPGEKVNTFASFKGAVERGLIGDDAFEDQRLIVNKLVNEYQTPGATERVYRYLVKLLKI
jgi:CDP-glycerol glycerophosphotransferase (TagB/SpsB family)